MTRSAIVTVPVLAINGILAAMVEERTALEEAGFVLKGGVTARGT
jgi:hypothetical protein